MTDQNSNITKDKPEINREQDIANIIDWVDQIKDLSTRENALVELNKKRESYPELAVYIWFSPGTTVALYLKEIITTYRILAPNLFTMNLSNKVCNVLALFQCIAAHEETRLLFVNSQIPLFLYPFLNTSCKNKAFEYLRLTALGVIGALVKSEDSEIIKILISTEIIPLCLRIMDKGTELSKTVSTFIIQRILLDPNGLVYMCNTAERFHAINSVLTNMLSQTPSSRLLKHIIRCYSRLAENHRARSILKENFPLFVKEKKFYDSLDENIKKWLVTFFKSIGISNSFSTDFKVSNSEMPNHNNLNVNNQIINNFTNSNERKLHGNK